MQAVEGRIAIRMMFVMKFVDEEACLFEELWFIVQAIRLQVAPVVVNDDVWCCLETGDNYFKKLRMDKMTPTRWPLIIYL